MKIDLGKINLEQFIIRECLVAGEDCALVFPSHLGAEWTRDNLHLRSVIVRKSDGQIISLGHKKFFNYSEKPELYPNPLDFNDWVISTKLDGSLIIVSRYKGELIIRTRGTSTVDVHETGPEIRSLLADFGMVRWIQLDDILKNNSLHFEHITPSNRIVIPYNNPELILLSAISHETGEYWDEKRVDELAKILGCKRPETHLFSSLPEIVSTSKTLRGLEGYVLAYNNNQNRIKLKTEDYLLKHRFRENINYSNLLDLFFQYGKPQLNDFILIIGKNFDFECSMMAKDLMTKISEAANRISLRLNVINEEIGPLHGLPRKDAAQKIISNYSGYWKSVAFFALDNQILSDKILRKLMEEELDSTK